MSPLELKGVILIRFVPLSDNAERAVALITWTGPDQFSSSSGARSKRCGGGKGLLISVS
jgi:hypothetical protein